ncbi:hypothetical protein TNCV_2412981 [Trichonephila clavipes]|nr:hypothetical protein TNCV_2412981 [Trichonephila clavipes]
MNRHSLILENFISRKKQCLYDRRDQLQFISTSPPLVLPFRLVEQKINAPYHDRSTSMLGRKHACSNVNPSCWQCLRCGHHPFHLGGTEGYKQNHPLLQCDVNASAINPAQYWTEARNYRSIANSLRVATSELISKECSTISQKEVLELDLGERPNRHSRDI